MASLIDVSVDGDHLCMEVAPSPEFIAQLGEDADHVEPPIPLRMLPDSDRYVVTDGPHDGEQGFFMRDAVSDAIRGIHVHGRYAPRTDPAH
ncbi:MAG: hypothetical protein ABIW50_06095 [Candidatus Limnocylindria bacterium]